MFFVHNLERELFLHPSFFDAHAQQNIRDKLHMDMEGKIIGEMMVVTIIEIDEISEPKLVPGTGMARYDVSYRAIVWRPFKGEVVDGMVSSVLANGFFVDVGGLNVFVSKAVSACPGLEMSLRSGGDRARTAQDRSRNFVSGPVLQCGFIDSACALDDPAESQVQC